MARQMMEVYSGDDLTEYLRENNIQIPSDDRIKQMQEYLESDCKDILCICGLDGTGKTSLMLYTMAELNDPAHTLYIICPKEDDWSDFNIERVQAEIEKHSDARYIFIDEVTRMPEFVVCASMLAWYMPIDTKNLPHFLVGERPQCTVPDRKMIITGKDSLSIIFAHRDELWNCSMMLYINGDVLPAIDDRYIDDAIAGNIVRTLWNYHCGIEDDISYGIRLDDPRYRHILDEDPDWDENQELKDAVIKSIRVVLKKKSGIVLSENEKIYLNMDKEAMESICYYLRLIGVLQGDDESGKLFRFQDDI